jgi:hypothetical protein
MLVLAHTAEIVAGVAGGSALAVLLVALVLYRNWRYEQELDSLLWKLDYRDIQMPAAEESNSNGGLVSQQPNANNSALGSKVSRVRQLSL